MVFLTNRQQFFMIYSLIDRRNDVKMFNNQVVSVLRGELKWPLSLTKLQSKGGVVPATKFFISADVKGKVCVCTGPRVKENEDSKLGLALKTKPRRLKTSTA